MLELSKFSRNEKLDNEGQTFEVAKGVSIQVAAWGNPKFKAKFSSIAKPHMAGMKVGAVADDVQNELMAKAMAGTILVGWKGFTENGKEVPFSVSKAEEILNKYSNLRDMVTGYAQTLAEVNLAVETEGIEAAKKA